MTETTPPPLPKAARKRVLPLVSVACMTALIGIAIAYHALGLHDPNFNRWRREWKDTTVASLAKQSADSAWVAKEISAVKAKLAAQGEEDDGWFSGNLLLLKNGDWIAYASRCSKEDWRIRDIFIGRASDGNWYYSTYHFCRGMLSLRVDDRPESLAKFIATYSLREFDGRSDECLKKTWPTPQP